MQALDTIVREDPVSRPLAQLYLAALRARPDGGWHEAARHLNGYDPSSDEPVLARQVIPVPRDLARSTLTGITSAIQLGGSASNGHEAEPLNHVDPLETLEAGINWDFERLGTLAKSSGMDASLFTTIATCATLPLLLECSAKAPGGYHAAGDWGHGYCPVCGSWPALAELRGLERQRWLRCGRCAAGWRVRNQYCIYCENAHHRSLGYLAPESQRESRRATTCEKCQGYLKELTVVSEVPIAELLARDLETIELDIAAIDRGFHRPEQPGRQLELCIEPAASRIERWWFAR